MKLFNYTLYYAAFFLSFASSSFSAESPSVHIAILESPTLITKTPFASRVHIFSSSNHDDDEEFNEHGVAVCSVLVGENSSLPENTSITLVPSIDQFSCYLETQRIEDLVIFNWSGSTGYPGLSQDNLEELDGLRVHFQSILEMNETEFSEQVSDYIKEYEYWLSRLPLEDNPLSDLLTYAKTCLLNIEKQPAERKKNREIYSMGLQERIETFSNHAKSRACVKYEEMKATLQSILTKHDNILIILALGNEGKCIDKDPFWQGLLSDQLILSHTILVYGLQNSGQKNLESNFTTAYNKHALGKPYCTQVWDTEKSRYILDFGTSFSAPLATIDIFIRAKEMLDQTGEVPSYAKVKQALLTK